MRCTTWRGKGQLKIWLLCIRQGKEENFEKDMLYITHLRENHEKWFQSAPEDDFRFYSLEYEIKHRTPTVYRGGPGV